MQSIPRKYREAQRFRQLVGCLIKHELHYVLHNAKIKKFSGKKAKPDTEPETIRNIFDEMGGTFVKLGQLLSLRPDLIPYNYSKELSKLQDEVKPFPYSEAKKIVESELGKKIAEVFSEFPKKPVASASIGQVYKAKLITGEEVAVKVQRPGIQKIVSTDIDIMAFFAKQINRYFKPKIFNPEEIIQEFKEYTEAELNYVYEHENLEKFYANFRRTSVKIPRPYPLLATKKVMVMEFVHGEKLSEKKNIKENKEIAEELVNAFFKQVFIDGFLHADPHPGNILILNKPYTQRIALLDFGIATKIDPDSKHAMKKLFVALIERDIEQIISAMIELHLIEKDTPQIRSDMRDLLSPYYAVSLSQINVPRLFIQSMKVARKHGMQMPKQYVLMGKALITLESVCRKINPDFNFVETSKPFIERLALQEYSVQTIRDKTVRKAAEFKALADSFPEKINQYFQERKEHELYVRKISSEITLIEKQIYRFTRGFMMLGIALVLLIAGFLTMNQPPFIQGIGIFSIIAFLLAFSAFITAIRQI